MGTEQSRKEKMMWFPFHIHNLFELGENNSKEKIISEFCVKFFASKKTAIEILKILLEAEKIIEQDNKLYIKEDLINSQFKSGIRSEQAMAKS